MKIPGFGNVKILINGIKKMKFIYIFQKINEWNCLIGTFIGGIMSVCNAIHDCERDDDDDCNLKLLFKDGTYTCNILLLLLPMLLLLF